MPVPEAVCPACHGTLSSRQGELSCQLCQAIYPVRDGIPCFAPSDDFYELRYDNKSLRFDPDERYPWNRLLLYLTTQHYLWFIRRFFVRPGAVLDLACGGGARYLARKGSAVGIDLSLESVKCLDECYETGVQGSAFALPFPDASFDYVTGKCILEHIPREKKPALLQEIRRVMKPGARLIMLFDVESTNPLWLWARREPALFQKAFIENDGHYGLIPPREALRLFESHGLRLLDFHAPNKTPLVHLPMLMWLRAYRGRSRLVDLAVRLAEAVVRRRLLNMSYTFAVTLWDDLVERFIDLDRARYLLVACEKVQ